VLAGVEDLLDPDVLGAALAQAPQVAGRIGQAVGVVDAQPVDDALAHEPQREPVRLGEHLGVLLAHAGEVVDVEEAPVPARRLVDVEEPRLSAGSDQYRLASSVAMWFGTMSRITPSPAPRTAATSASNASSPPELVEIDVGSTTS
jgi:hypothetical protein